ncbi:MAG: hypothetical protein KG012_11710 [Deltaproteobacteria bacterium]|nr:hypothetical protein [Deltaproteobacteria bacterium]
MKTGRTALTIVIALLPILLSSGIGFAQTKGAKETIFFSGIVKNVSWDHKSIIVNDRSFFISQDTKIIDHKGNRLKIDDIEKNADVGIDAIKHPNGFMIKEIVVITNRGV